MFGGFAYLEDISGKEMGRTAFSSPLLPESTLSIGGKQVEVESLLSREEYLSGKTSDESRVIEAPKPRVGERPLPKPRPAFKAATPQEKEDRKTLLNVSAPKIQATRGHYKNPMLETTIMPKDAISKDPTPRHDPNACRAIVMKRPKETSKGRQVVDVVVDPLLSKHLRDHQREGVKFLYECVMDIRDFGGQGAILADEMGLGKTLQTITLLWTLLKQNPVYEAAPVIKKALIVCPATLINNWKKEFRKWLGSERIGVFVFDDSRKRITDFTLGRTYSVLIIGYEKLRSTIDELQKGHGIDIVIADEGHRLKTQQNKSGVALRSLSTPRRIILSGTPIQNDLSEFFCMVDFVNPGVLGSVKSFSKQFEAPIVKSRQPAATTKDVERGQVRSDELAETTSTFILRRTADILSKYLPTKTEYVLLCRPRCAQIDVYHQVLASPMFQSALGNAQLHLQLITILKKVCNSPRLLRQDNVQDPEKETLATELASAITPKLLHNRASIKMRVLDALLHTLRETTSEKIILVSNFTATLDILSELLASLSMPFLRLDGSTQTKHRQDLVDTFNRTPASTHFAFLLSAKAGGMGLNLIGASRLVLFDVDWNPAIDAQAMARIHRDGQKRPCVIYRLLMAGSLDEKIWQRQVTKLGLADSVMEKKSGTSSFTRDELKDLFRLDEGLECQTHELIKCNCGGRGMPDVATDIASPVLKSEDDDEDLPDIPTLLKANKVDMEEQEHRIREDEAAARKEKDGANMRSLMNYSHIDTSRFATKPEEDLEALIHDDVLLSVLKDEGNPVSFVFAKTSGG